MPAIVWDQVGERVFQGGIDRGVLYLNEGGAVPWNGLTAVEETFGITTTPYYMDGVKYMDRQSPGDFSAKLKAFTYPDELEAIMGVASQGNGMNVHDQPPSTFGLSYRTKVGTDLNPAAGYKIHLLYGISADPEAQAYASHSGMANAIEFGWALTGTPPPFPGFRPTSHISFTSTRMAPAALKALEDILYGNNGEVPRQPLPTELLSFIDGYFSLVDNGDGTWTATGSNKRVKMLNSTSFEISDVDATYYDDNTYEITTTS